MNVRRWAQSACLGVGAAALAAGATLAATTPAPAPAAAAATPVAKAAAPRKKHKKAYPAQASYVEPAATAALTRMSNYLRTVPTFVVKTETERDEVDDFGQLLTFDGEVTYKVKKPDNLTLDATQGATTRSYIYDGKSVTQYDPATGFYARFDAAPTIGQTLELAATQYGIDIPLYDLFQWGQGNDNLGALTSAHYVGSSKVNGQDADQYSFRQPGVDWQIWIAKGDKPLPLRVIIVASDDPARPQFESTLTWDTAPTFAADTFTFTPPANAKQIQIKPSAQ
jgi:hypothetical protein